MITPSIIPKAVTEYDLRLLRIFKVVVESGGFSAAEAELGVTRSTISIHMSNLEARLKVKLCLRGRGGFSLTKDGQVIYAAIIKLFNSLDDFSLLANSLSDELSGEIVILCSDTLSISKQQKLANVIKYVNKEAPNLHIVLDGDSLTNIEKSLLADKAHMGIYPTYRKVDGLNYKEIMCESIYLCCSNTHPFFNKVDSQISAEDLSQMPAIHPGIDIDLNGREQLKKLNLAAKAYQFDSRKAMILSGCYLGFLPQSYIQNELNKGEIRIIKPDSLTYQFKLSMAFKKTPREERKIELLKIAFAEAYKCVE